jgi:hypothetical protein
MGIHEVNKTCKFFFSWEIQVLHIYMHITMKSSEIFTSLISKLKLWKIGIIEKIWKTEYGRLLCFTILISHFESKKQIPTVMCRVCCGIKICRDWKRWQYVEVERNRNTRKFIRVVTLKVTKSLKKKQLLF